MSTSRKDYSSGSSTENRLSELCGADQRCLQIAPHHDLEAEAGPSFTRETWASVKARRPEAAAPSFRGFRVFKSPKGVEPRTPSVGPSSTGSPTDNTSDPREERSVSIAPPQSDTRTEDLNSLVKELESGMKRLDINMYEQRYHGKVSSTSFTGSVNRQTDLPRSQPPKH